MIEYFKNNVKIKPNGDSPDETETKNLEQTSKTESKRSNYIPVIFLIIVLIISAGLHIYQFNTISKMKDETRLLNQELESYVLKRPTLEELKTFLSDDQTDKRYVTELYDCKNFATDLRFNGRIKGYNICLVIVDINYHFKGPNGTWTYYGGHTINGVLLDSGDFVYVEPQHDLILENDSDNLKDHISRMLYDDLVLMNLYNIELVEIEIIDEVHVW